MLNRRLILGLVAGLVLGGGVATIAYSAAGGDLPGFDAAHSDLTIGGAAAFPDFPLYSAGQSFEGLPLSGMTRRLEARQAPDPVRANFVSFRYGDCTPGPGEFGCPAPLEIQVWPACERNLSSYSLTPMGDPLPHERVTVRGAPAAFFEGGQRLEIYTGSVSVVLFGQSKAQLLRAAASLRGANASGRVMADGRLPAAAAGALEGRLAC
jgi:hypothetical protein